MLKQPESLKGLVDRAVMALKRLLEAVPAIALKRVAWVTGSGSEWSEVSAILSIQDRPHELLCVVEPVGQPRQVRGALLWLRDRLPVGLIDRTPVLVAPYLSAEARALCIKQEIGFIDLEGNCRLVIGGVFIERTVPRSPSSHVRRQLRSIFKAKSAGVLRVLLRDPRRSWRVVELAAAADASVGQTSNVRRALLDREWAEVGTEGLVLTCPDALLDAWRDEYEPPAGVRRGFYTTLHGAAFEAALRGALGVADEHGAAILASFSAAQWLAPYARAGTQYFYADEDGVGALARALKLSSSALGENVVITCLRDRGLFRDRVEGAPGVFCTSPVQTYLDLTAAGERGREAAEHLRREKLTWRR